jgi:hypothetical protein
MRYDDDREAGEDPGLESFLAIDNSCSKPSGPVTTRTFSTCLAVSADS